MATEAEYSEGMWEKAKRYLFGDGPIDFGPLNKHPQAPYYGLENKTPYSLNLKFAGTNPNWGWTYSNDGFGPNPYINGVRPDYWQTIAKYQGEYVSPEGYPADRGGPLVNQERVPNLIYPTQGIYASTPYQIPAPLYVNGMADEMRGIPNKVAPKLTEQRRVIRMNTPAEKAAYLASQNERGFQLVGDSYVPVTDTRLAGNTMLSTERIPFFGDYRAGQATAGKPFMSAVDALKYYPQYLKDPRTLEALAIQGGRAVQGVGIALTAADAVNRRDLNFTDFYNREHRDPTTLEDYALRIKSGLEPVANVATFGMYDYFADNPTYKAEMDAEARDRAIRAQRQLGIDYPFIGTQRFERTTK